MNADASRVLTNSIDNTAILWDARSGNELRKYHFWNATLSRDGRQILATTLGDRGVFLLDAQSGKQLKEFWHVDQVNFVRFSDDGNRILTACRDKTAVLWNAAAAEILKIIKIGELRDLRLSSDGRRFLSLIYGNGESEVQLWDAESGKVLWEVEREFRFVEAIALSADGRRTLLAVAKDAVLRDSENGEVLQTFKGHSDGITCVSLCDDSRLAATGSEDKSVILWNTETGAQLHKLIGHSDEIQKVLISADGRRVLTSAGGKELLLWDTENGKRLQSFDSHASVVNQVSLADSGSRILTGSDDKTASLWDLSAGKKQRTFSRHDKAVTSVDLSADGRRALSGSKDKTAILWDTDAGNVVQTFKGHESEINSVALGHDGRRAVTGSSDDKAILWNTETGAKVQTFEDIGIIRSVALSRDGRRVATSSFVPMLWDTQTGAEIRRFVGHEHNVMAALMSDDATRIISGSMDFTAILWRSETGEIIRQFKHHMPSTRGVAISADGHRLLINSFAVDGDLNKVLLVDAETGKELQSFEGHTAQINCVLLSRDLRRVVTSSEDGTVRIWDAESGRQLAALLSLGGGRDWLAVTPDGYFDGSENGRQRVSYRKAGTLEFVPLEVVRERFKRPGLLSKAWKGDEFRKCAS
jgi:WD40 repeat protein